MADTDQGPWQDYAQPAPSHPAAPADSPSPAPSPADDSGPWQDYAKTPKLKTTPSEPAPQPTTPPTDDNAPSPDTQSDIPAEPNSTPTTPPKPDYTPAKTLDPEPLVNANLKEFNASDTPAEPMKPGQQVAHTFLEAFEGGMQGSSTGFIVRQKLPDYVAPQNASLAMSIAMGMGQAAGDLPVNLVGKALGAYVGEAVPVVGPEIGAQFGMFALPAYVRSVYRQELDKGPAANFEETFGRLASSIWNATKEGLVGVGTFGAGGAAVGALGKVAKNKALGSIATMAAKPLVQTAAQSVAELSAMTAIGAGMQGHVPEWRDFAVNAGVLAGVHIASAAIPDIGASKEQTFAPTPEHPGGPSSGEPPSPPSVPPQFVPPETHPLMEKLMNIWADTGIHPADVILKADKDAVLTQELLSMDGTRIPPSLQKAAEPEGPNAKKAGDTRLNMIPADVPPELAEAQPEFSKDFDPDDKAMIASPPESPEEPTSASSKESDEEPPEPGSDEHVKDTVLGRIQDVSVKKKFSVDEAMRQVEDKLNPLKVLERHLNGGERLPSDESAYDLMRTSNGFPDRVRDMLKNGVWDYSTGERITRGLEQIVNGHAGDEDILWTHALLRHALDRDSAGFETGFFDSTLKGEIVKDANGDAQTLTREQARDWIEKTKGKYGKSADEITDFQNAVLKYARDGQVISHDAYDNLTEKWPNYVPSNRVVDENPATGSTMGKGLKKVKELQGSELFNRNPLEMIVRNTVNWVKEADINKAALKFQDNIDEKGGIYQGLAEPVSRSMQKTVASPEELTKWLEKNNGYIPDDPTELALYRARAQRVGSEEMVAFRDGEPDIRNVGQAVAEAFKSNPYSPNAILDWAALPSKALQMGAVELSPWFPLRHFSRDAESAPLFSKNGFTPWISSFQGLGKLMFKDSYYQDLWHDFVASGASRGNIQDLLEGTIGKDVYSLSKKTGLLDTGLNVVRNPLQLFKLYQDILSHMSHLAFNAAPFEEFSLARNNGATPQEAAMSARSVTPDTQLQGANMTVQALSRLNAFWKIRKTGNAMIAEQLKNNPQEFMKRWALMQMMPTAYLWYVNKDKPWYTSAERYVKDMYSLVENPISGVVHKISKAFEPGVWASAGERILDGFYRDNPDCMKGWIGTALETAIPIPWTTGGKPVLEQLTNHSFLSGGKLIPDKLVGKSPQFQVTNYTTDSAKLLGSMVQHIPGMDHPGSLASPIVLENYIKQWGSYNAILVLKQADKVLNAGRGAAWKYAPNEAQSLGIQHPSVEPMAPGPADGSFGGAFNLRYPDSRQPVSDFYDNYNEVKRYKDDVKSYKDAKDFDGLKSFLQTPTGRESQINMEGAYNMIRDMQKVKTAATVDPSTTPMEKRRLYDEYEMRLIQMANSANQNFQNARKGISQ